MRPSTCESPALRIFNPSLDAESSPSGVLVPIRPALLMRHAQRVAHLVQGRAHAIAARTLQVQLLNLVSDSPS